ncbi:MAG: NAD(P)-dependent oxidoreductase [Pseudomonadota bacterium]
MRVLVTGATGFLGGAVSRALHRDGGHVIATGRNAEKLTELSAEGITVAMGDLADWTSPAHAVDAVVHCAGLSSPWGSSAAFERANVAGTAGALRLAREGGARTFVHISTPSVTAAFRDQLSVAEDAPLPRPVNTYARTKLKAERLVEAADIASRVVIRPRGLYGPGDTALLPRLVRAANAGPLPLMRNGQAVIDLTFIDDAVAAIRAGLGTKHDGYRLYHVSGGEAVRVTTIADEAAALTGIRIAWRRVTVGAAMMVAGLSEARAWLTGDEPKITRYAVGLFAFSQTLDIGRIERELGWRPRVSFAEGLERLRA